jgi:putative ubiquitin-RnfH superfamily antitoxin RatB of RatAB toxin-antitoxin module
MDHVDIEWVCSPAPGAPLQRERLCLPEGAKALDALKAAGWTTLPQGWALAIWGRRVTVGESLRTGDRLELLRPLSVDPMQARRRRHALTGRRIVSRHRPLPQR